MCSAKLLPVNRFCMFEHRIPSQVHTVHCKIYGHLWLKKVVKNSVVS